MVVLFENTFVFYSFHFIDYNGFVLLHFLFLILNAFNPVKFWKQFSFFCDLNRRIHDRYVPSSCLLRFGCTFYCWLINTHQIGVAVGMRSKNRKEISGSFTAQLPIVRRVQPLCMYLSVSRLSHLLPELNFVAFFSSLQSYSHFILKTKNFFSSSVCVLTRLLLIIYSIFC